MSDPVDPRFTAAPCIFFVIGAQKSGTTWLHEYFVRHRDVAVPAWKETNYWNRVEAPVRLAGLPETTFGRMREKFGSALPEARSRTDALIPEPGKASG